MKHPVVWFEVLGKDGKKLQEFYSELFGWQIKVDNPMGYGMVDTGAKSGVPGGVGGTYQDFGPWVTFYVESPDLAASLEAAKKLGGKVVMPPKKMPDGPELALFQDPEGHVIGLVCAPAVS
jgi:predicted enzyme related to lactoylglutathione lyase